MFASEILSLFHNIVDHLNFLQNDVLVQSVIVYVKASNF